MAAYNPLADEFRTETYNPIAHIPHHDLEMIEIKDLDDRGEEIQARKSLAGLY
jgi:hypothetical protein